MPLKFSFISIEQSSSSSAYCSDAELRGSLDAELSLLKLELETEIAELNLMEPLLAQAKSDDAAYRDAIAIKTEKKVAMEYEYNRSVESLTAKEAHRKDLQAELEVIWSRLSKVMAEIPESAFIGSTWSTKLSVTDVKKMVSLLVADSQKLNETENEINNLNNKILIIQNSKNSENKSEKSTSLGFVPIDIIGLKRRRDEERFKELEKRRPEILVPPIDTTVKPPLFNLSGLADLVALLSEDEEDDVINLS